VENVVLAQADSTVYLLVSAQTPTRKNPSIQEPDLARMEQWLSIRLQTPAVKVYLLPEKE